MPRAPWGMRRAAVVPSVLRRAGAAYSSAPARHTPGRKVAV
eukprot:gene18943-60202_t